MSDQNSIPNLHLVKAEVDPTGLGAAFLFLEFGADDPFIEPLLLNASTEIKEGSS